MCLVAFRHRTHPRHALVLLANRDEYHARPSAPSEPWADAPSVLAGRDLLGGGTWLGVTRTGRWAAITNVRSPAPPPVGAPSRGALVRDFLVGDAPPLAYAEAVASRASTYPGFNLLVGDREHVAYLGSPLGHAQLLPPGDYALSNATLDVPWPKVSSLRTKLRDPGFADDEHAMFEMLADETPATDDALPDTGVGLPLERFLSPIFLRGDVYGTRASTILRVDDDGAITWIERTFGPSASFLGERRSVIPAGG